MVDDELLAHARAARAHAYAPYSRFAVGAAVVGASGAVYTGCNVENASFGHTVCAERVAIWKAISEGETAIVAVAVVTDTSPPASPCGSCRQVMHEFGPRARVIYAGLGEEAVVTTVDALLPAGFDPQVLLGR